MHKKRGRYAKLTHRAVLFYRLSYFPINYVIAVDRMLGAACGTHTEKQGG